VVQLLTLITTKTTRPRLAQSKRMNEKASDLNVGGFLFKWVGRGFLLLRPKYATMQYEEPVFSMNTDKLHSEETSNHRPDMTGGVTGRWLTQEELSQISYFDPLLRIWNANSDSGKIMSRRGFTPHDLKEVLPYISIIELDVVDGKIVDAVGRLVGTQLTPIYGEMTGKSINLMEPMVRTRIWESLERAFDTRRPAGRYAEALSEKRPFVSLVSVFCPLATDGVNIDKMISLITLRTRGEAGLGAYCD